jgi:hypothetical protein
MTRLGIFRAAFPKFAADEHLKRPLQILAICFVRKFRKKFASGAVATPAEARTTFGTDVLIFATRTQSVPLYIR